MSFANISKQNFFNNDLRLLKLTFFNTFVAKSVFIDIGQINMHVKKMFFYNSALIKLAKLTMPFTHLSASITGRYDTVNGLFLTI